MAGFPLVGCDFVVAGSAWKPACLKVLDHGGEKKSSLIGSCLCRETGNGFSTALGLPFRIFLGFGSFLLFKIRYRPVVGYRVGGGKNERARTEMEKSTMIMEKVTHQETKCS